MNNSGIPSIDRYRRQVIKDSGTAFYQKNKQLLYSIFREKELYIPGRKVPFKINPDENFNNMVKVVKMFKKIIKTNLYANGFNCSNSVIKDLDLDDVSTVVLLLALMPVLYDRWEGGDNLPGLYLYGLPNTGKSFMFNASPYYRKIATDAQGVSRFQLQGVESAWLLDDVKATTLDEPAIFTTLRQITLGSQATVKTKGATMNVRGFVVVTSNDNPLYLGEVPAGYTRNWEMNSSAWKRRFISIYMNVQLDLLPIEISFEHTSTKEAVMCLVKTAYDNLHSETAKRLFTNYINTLEKDLSVSCYNRYLDIKEKVDDWVDIYCPI